MQVRAGRPSGLPDVTVRIPLQHALARFQPPCKATKVSVVRAVSPMVSQYDQVAITVLEPCKGYDPIARRLHLRSRGCTVVDSLVRPPLLKNGMPAQAEPRSDAGEFQR